MTDASLMSPYNDSITTPKESLKTPKFTDMAGGLAALRSPRDWESLNTPLLLPTPRPGAEGLLSTPTLTTPRTADWGLFSPINLGGSACSSPRDHTRDQRPSDLPLDSSIGLSSPHDGMLAKRRKLKNLNSFHSRSVESDSNSCDTPTADKESLPCDLSKKGPSSVESRSRLNSDSSPGTVDGSATSPTYPDLDRVRDRVGSVALSSSPKWFKHPKSLPECLKLGKELLSDLPASYHASPLAVPSPNWTTISALLSSEGMALKTPKVLDNFVFDVLPPNTPNTPKFVRERSPEKYQHKNYEPAKAEDMRIKPKQEERVSVSDQPRPHSLTPPPPYPEDLSMPHKHNNHIDVVPKQEFHDSYRGPSSPRHDVVKEEPRDYSTIPPDFPPYYLHPEIQPQHSYRRQHDRPNSPPASPPRQYGQHQSHQFYNPAMQGARQLNLASSVLGGYDNGGSQAHYNPWANHHQNSHRPQGLQDIGGHHVTMPTPPQSLWRGHPIEQLHSVSGYHGLKPNLDKNQLVKSETRLSTDSEESEKKKKKNRDNEEQADEQPPKKRGKGKTKDTNGPKRVFVCPHCQRSYDWNYNLNRHLKYECGKENAFMCSKCGRRFPHKQNCVYHLKRKHKIILETIDQYMSAGLVVFQGGAGAGGGSSQPSPSGYSPGSQGGTIDPDLSPTPPPTQQTC